MEFQILRAKTGNKLNSRSFFAKRRVVFSSFKIASIMARPLITIIYTILSIYEFAIYEHSLVPKTRKNRGRGVIKKVAFLGAIS